MDTKEAVYVVPVGYCMLGAVRQVDRFLHLTEVILKPHIAWMP